MIQSEPRVVCEVIGEANERTENDFPGSIEPTPTLVDDISDVYSDTITLDTAETVTEILRIRKNIIESMKKNQDLMDGN